MKYKAAIRDPLTGKIFTGFSHSHAADAAREAGDKAVAMRIFKELSVATVNTGFVDSEGKFYTRSEAHKLFGFSTSQEMHRKELKDIEAAKNTGGM